LEITANEMGNDYLDTLQGQHIANGNHYVKPKKWLSIVGMIDK
jgi:hypothetical protein